MIAVLDHQHTTSDKQRVRAAVWFDCVMLYVQIGYRFSLVDTQLRFINEVLSHTVAVWLNTPLAAHSQSQCSVC